jgi:8-oxo-dGTP pyrophosphatase MutT (NUDIX family)
MSIPETVVAHEINGSTRVVSTKNMSFRISVYGVTIDRNTVLLVPQWDGYDIPGGGIELGETTEEALKREVYEETGLVVRPHMQHILHVTQDFFIHPTDGKSYHYILLYYPCSPIGGKISDANFQEDEKEYAQAAKWVPVETLGELKFYNPVDSVSIIETAHRLMDSAIE